MDGLTPMKVACIGECMVEFAQEDGSLFRRGFGGDTLNTALYLARLGVPTSYVTALGDDPLSAMMLAAWQAEGIDTSEVLKVEGRAPGLYMIERDAKGERSFLYWRDRAPARELFDRADRDMLDRLSRFDWIYLSGISLSLYGETGKAKLRELLTVARKRGARVVFDGNYRPRNARSAPSCRWSTSRCRPWRTSRCCSAMPMPPSACAVSRTPGSMRSWSSAARAAA